MLKDFSDFESIDNEIDYSKVNLIIKEEREKSIELLKKAIGIRENNITSIGLHNNCTGCRNCEQLCPKNAITMKLNKEGFLEPEIDKNKCINCGICLKRCPQANNDIERNTPSKCIAAKNKDEEMLKKGSSGSIFEVLGAYILKNNGTIYGVAFNNKLDLNTIRIENKDDLEKLMGSKYIQSNTQNTFKLVKEDLENGRKVLYTGTPCQIAGLKSYLNKDYDNLLLVDLVCHGVPSEKLFKKYIEYMEKKYNSKIINYSFRSKEKNGWGLTAKVRFENGKKKYINANVDSYYKSFLEGKTYREACYNCKYANTNRVGDITLADYWGIKKEHPEFETTLGVSAVLINTEKGNEILEKLKDNIKFAETKIDRIANANKNLVKPTKRPDIRSYVYNDIDELDYKQYSKQNLKFTKEFKDVLKNIVPSKVKKIIKNTILGGK